MGCNSHFEARHLEVDHIIAQGKGGTDHIENLQLLRGSCNRIKGDRGMDLPVKLQLQVVLQVQAPFGALLNVSRKLPPAASAASPISSAMVPNPTGLRTFSPTSRGPNPARTGYACFPVPVPIRRSSPMLAAMRAADSITESSAR